MSVEKRETVNQSVKVETRADGAKVITGYAAVFYDPTNRGTEYQIGRQYVERINSRAFEAALNSQEDVVGAFNHDPSMVLGRRSAGTLRLSVDSVGLRYEIDVNTADPDHMRVLPKIERGDVRGSSFAFSPREGGQKFSEEATGRVRSLESVKLYDVGPVTTPAYAATSTGLRAVGETKEAEAAFAEWQSKREAEAVAVRMRRLELENS
jgi:uncharacterized protein